MTSIQVSRRALAGGLTAATAGLGLANMARAAAGDPELAAGDGISHTAAAIHQEVVLKRGPPARLRRVRRRLPGSMRSPD